MPININLLGYNMFYEEQKDSEKYPNLNGPDYAYSNDFNERIKYSNYFENNNLTPIKLIA